MRRARFLSLFAVLRGIVAPALDAYRDETAGRAKAQAQPVPPPRRVGRVPLPVLPGAVPLVVLPEPIKVEPAKRVRKPAGKPRAKAGKPRTTKRGKK